MEERKEIFDAHCIVEVELIYRNPVKPSSRPKISGSRSAYEMFLKSWDAGKIELQEHFKIMLIKRGNKVLGILLLSIGGVHATVVDRKLIFATALKSNACGIIMAHNHPSGAVLPSEADIALTKRVVAAGKILEIDVLDHMVISRDGYYSFNDEGLI